MQTLCEKKLDKISEVWNTYIWEYKFCNSKIKFTDDVKSNYFGDILRYFSDTLSVILKPQPNSTNFYEIFESTISFLQAIYLQQDFVEELLIIFKCNIINGQLQLDRSYKINRDIRNELVGHPIRKSKQLNKKTGKNELKLLSSTVFSTQMSHNKISYLRYHIDQNYEVEFINYTRADILNRHLTFLNTYFDKILNKLEQILSKFKRKIQEIENSIDIMPFENLIKMISQSFEYIYRIDPLYKPEHLLKAYKLRNQHIRYSNAIKLFKAELKESIKFIKNGIDDFVNKKYINDILEPSLNTTSQSTSYDHKVEEAQKRDFQYELSKLSEIRNINDYRFFSSFLKNYYHENGAVMEELKIMEDNLENETEYYCSYKLLVKLLSE